jgi:hypothetical protein
MRISEEEELEAFYFESIMNSWEPSSQDEEDEDDEVILEDTDDSDDNISEILYDSDYEDYLLEIFNYDLTQRELYGFNLEAEKYYIGSFCNESNNLIVSITITSGTFFKYPSNIICNYLHDFSIMMSTSSNIHIIKLDIGTDGVFNAILKTFWLKIIQRKWKKIYKQKQDIIRKRKSLFSIRNREIHGCLKDGTDYYPSIYGMLCDIKV